jgi:uncharacterized membrane protein YebE (DUF533 family)
MIEKIKAKFATFTGEQKLIAIVVVLLLASMVLTSLKTFGILCGIAVLGYAAWKAYQKYAKKDGPTDTTTVPPSTD